MNEILDNEHLGTRGDWADREARFHDRLKELAPDVVTLQEAVRTDEIEQARRLPFSWD